jgi:redox-sensitive bicupin YhaK (pirin superfamily)
VHSEINQSPDPCRLLQIWIEPTQTGLSPAYEQQPMPPGSGWTRLLDPDRKDGALAIARPVRLWRAQVEAGDSLNWPTDLTGPGWLQVIDGQFTLNAAAATLPAQLRCGDGLGFPKESIPGEGLQAVVASDLLLFALA